MRRALPVVVLALVACKSERKEGQNFRQGMMAVCTAHEAAGVAELAPAERNQAIARWVDAHVTNREARKAFEVVGTVAPDEGARILAAEAKRAGLEGCAIVDLVNPPPKGPTVVAGDEEIELDPDATYGELADAARALAATANDLRLVVGDTTIPLAVPSSEPVAGDLPQDPDTVPVGVALALGADDAIVWSVSGREGTLAEPKARAPLGDIEKIRTALAEIVARRWSGGAPRLDADRTLLVLADPDLALDAVVPYLTAAQASFPEVTLGAGIE